MMVPQFAGLFLSLFGQKFKSSVESQCHPEAMAEGSRLRQWTRMRDSSLALSMTSKRLSRLRRSLLREKVRVRGQFYFQAPLPHSSPVKREGVGEPSAADKGSVGLLSLVAGVIFAAVFLLTTLAQAQKLEQIIAEAKKEGEVTLVASASTFGGKKGFAELENHFAKRYGFKARLNLTGGPSFPQVAARIITEQKAGAKSSTDLYLGSDGTYVTMHQEKALQMVNWSAIFPWVTKEMEIFPQESVLVYASFHGIIYNSNSIPKDKAPKSYEDLIDPALSPTWAGKMAIPAYIHWLVRVSPIWGREKVLAFARKLAPLVGGRLRQGEEERIVSGEFPVMASTGGALEAMWKWQAKSAPLVGLPGSTPATMSYYQLAVPKNSVHPNMARLLIALMVTREGQSVLEKYDMRSSHLIDGTLMAKYVKANNLKLQDPKELNEVFQKADASLDEELTKILLK
jgi:ABC-type Fe3+ transport system substrate-binding protein